VSEHKPYMRDLSDERWTLIEPVITAGTTARPSAHGHQGEYEIREDGIDQTIHDLPRWQVRQKQRRSADPSLVVIEPERARRGRRAAAMHDNAIDNALLDRVAATTPRGSVQTALVDQDFKSNMIAYGAKPRHRSEDRQANPVKAGFAPQPQRWMWNRPTARCPSTVA
jgi:hypothetical protein